MSAMFERIRPRAGRLFAFAIALAIGLACSTVAAETVVVNVDQSRLMRLPERTATLVIGNPLIADASLQRGGIMVLTGKGFGSTNLIALDRKGVVLAEHSIRVEGKHEHAVVVYRGSERETYSCTPACEPRITLGDSSRYFSSTLTQTTTLSDMASAHARVGQDVKKDEDREKERAFDRALDRLLDRGISR
jgi:hypothetical protein